MISYATAILTPILIGLLIAMEVLYSRRHKHNLNDPDYVRRMQEQELEMKRRAEEDQRLAESMKHSNSGFDVFDSYGDKN